MNQRNIKITLPEKLSDLLLEIPKQIGLLDKNKYSPYHGNWHRIRAGDELLVDRKQDRVCHVCLAGAWAATQYIAHHAPELRTGDIFAGPTSDQETIISTTGPRLINGVLQTLECIRTGDYTAALTSYYPGLKQEKTRDTVAHIPAPTDQLFSGWPSFKRHLKSLIPIAKETTGTWLLTQHKQNRPSRTTMTKKIKLPEKLSAFIRLIVADSQSLDTRLYTPDALSWHLYKNNTCRICFAGAWLATMYVQQKQRELLTNNLIEVIKQVEKCLTSQKHDTDTVITTLDNLRTG